MQLHCHRFTFDLNTPRVMAIVNLTPDSFYDGGTLANTRAAIDFAQAQWQAGADILDIGAESSRPGAQAIDADTEWLRLEPILRELVQWPVAISVDTYRASTMRRALDLGVDLINDIRGFRDQSTQQQLAAYDCGLIVMHMQGEPQTMQQAVRYHDVIIEVRDFLAQQVTALRQAGVADDRMVIDPGFGFGKQLTHNLELLRHLGQLSAHPALEHLPLLAGLSRKSMLGQITSRAVADRLPATLGAHWAALTQGARLLRVHDVAAHVDLIALWQAYSDSMAATDRVVADTAVIDTAVTSANPIATASLTTAANPLA